MRRYVNWLLVLSALANAIHAPSLAAQTDRTGWNDARTRQVVDLATARRAQQLADTGLVDYQASAHGYLTFLAQVGEGFTEPPRIVKADELALEVYWKSPNLSKQRILGRRDTLLLPTDINYHRDHLGIVQNNFPETIRLGDGDEVRDVPHPLSARGMGEYDFSIRDSLRIVIPGRSIDVYEVRVRPKNDRAPRIVGALFIDRDGGQVVRMAFSFTRSAFLDKNLEDLSIVLENRLVGARFWLPSRQEIEIRRTGQWLDYPARGIIRGRWEISDYKINQGFAASMFAGPEIVQAPPTEQRRYPWTGRVLDSLPPDVRAVTDADVQRVQEEARALVRAEALQRGRSSALAARGISEFVRFNRVEGLAVGAGLRQRLGGGFGATLRGRYGFEDGEAKGELAVGWETAAGRGLRLGAYRDYRDAGDERERSGVVNSLAAQEFGSDYTDPYEVVGVGLDVALGRMLGGLWRARVAFEGREGVEVNATPANGHFRSTIDASGSVGTAMALSYERPTALWLFGTEMQFRAETRWYLSEGDDCELEPDACGRPAVRRLFASLTLERPVHSHRFVLLTSGAVVGGEGLTVEELALFGGPLSAPGYDFHSIAATAALQQRVEWRVPVPFFPLSLGRFGRAPARATLAPFASAVLARPIGRDVRGNSASSFYLHQWGGAWRGYPSVGVGLLTVFDLIRFDVARGLRDGRWIFNVDVTRDFWRVL